MVWLKTQEESTFIAFFKLVQNESQKRNAVFFLECGEGNDFVGNGIEGEALRDWLIPITQADVFEKEGITGTPGARWEDNIMWAIWCEDFDKSTIQFKQF